MGFARTDDGHDHRQGATFSVACRITVFFLLFFRISGTGTQSSEMLMVLFRPPIVVCEDPVPASAQYTSFFGGGGNNIANNPENPFSILITAAAGTAWRPRARSSRHGYLRGCEGDRKEAQASEPTGVRWTGGDGAEQI